MRLLKLGALICVSSCHSVPQAVVANHIAFAECGVDATTGWEIVQVPVDLRQSLLALVDESSELRVPVQFRGRYREAWFGVGSNWQTLVACRFKPHSQTCAEAATIETFWRVEGIWTNDTPEGELLEVMTCHERAR
jgi:hypothetical protein